MRRLRWGPGVFTAAIFVAGGLYLVAPFVLVQHRFDFVEGVVQGVHLHPLADRRVAVVYRFSFPVDERLLTGFDGEVRAFGIGRCDIIGRSVEDPVFDGDDPLLHTYLRSVRDGGITGRRGMVYYRSEDPLTTARINLNLNARRLAIGIAMLLTPVAVLLCRLLLGLVSGTLFKSGPTQSEPTSDR